MKALCALLVPLCLASGGCNQPPAPSADGPVPSPSAPAGMESESPEAEFVGTTWVGSISHQNAEGLHRTLAVPARRLLSTTGTGTMIGEREPGGLRRCARGHDRRYSKGERTGRSTLNANRHAEGRDPVAERVRIRVGVRTGTPEVTGSGAGQVNWFVRCFWRR
jgi:hypothetical protein